MDGQFIIKRLFDNLFLFSDKIHLRKNVLPGEVLDYWHAPEHIRGRQESIFFFFNSIWPLRDWPPPPPPLNGRCLLTSEDPSSAVIF